MHHSIATSALAGHSNTSNTAGNSLYAMMTYILLAMAFVMGLIVGVSAMWLWYWHCYNIVLAPSLYWHRIATQCAQHRTGNATCASSADIRPGASANPADNHGTDRPNTDTAPSLTMADNNDSPGTTESQKQLFYISCNGMVHSRCGCAGARAFGFQLSDAADACGLIGSAQHAKVLCTKCYKSD